MAVDEKYIEEVKNEEEFDDIMAELGLDGEFQQVGNGINLEGYDITNLRDMYAGDICNGRPIISDVYEVEFTDKKTGDTIINHKIDLVLLDDDEYNKEASVFTCNLNSDNIDFDKNIVKDVYNASGLYALAMGFAELKAKGISKSFNHLKSVGYKKLQKDAEKYEDLTVEVIEKKMTIKGEENYYNAFKIVDGVLKE